MDWNYIFSLRPNALDDNEKDTLLNTIAWYDIDVDDVDYEKCCSLFKISQEIMKYKSEQVEALVAELDELAKKQAEDEIRKTDFDPDSRSQKSKKSSSLEFDELEEKYRDVKSKLKQQNKSNEKLKHEINKLNQQMKILEQDRNYLQNELQSLQKDETQSDISENIRDQHKELMESIRQKNKQISQLLNDIEVIESENAELKEQLSNVRDKLSEATGQINKMTDEFLAYNIKIDEQEATIENLNQQNEGLNLQIEEISSDNSNLKKQLEDFALAIDHRVDEWRKVLDEKNEEIADLKLRIPSQNGRSDSSEISDARTLQIQSEISALNKVIFDRDNKIYDLQKELANATEDIKETTEILNRMNDEKEMSFEQLKSLKERNKEMKEKFKTSHSRCQELQGEIIYLQELLGKKDGDIEEIIGNLKKDGGVEIGDFLEKYQNLKLQKRRKEKQIVDLVRDANKLQEGFERFEKENLELRARLGLSEDEIVPTSHVLTKQRKQKKLVQDLQTKITKLEEEKLTLRVNFQKQAQIINNLTKQLNELNTIPIIDLQDGAQSNDEQQGVVDENEALRKGLHEILNSLTERKDKGYRDINSETLEKLLQALDSKHISGWYHSGMRLQAEIHNLHGRNNELREQLKLARLELNNFKKQTKSDSDLNTKTTTDESSNASKECSKQKEENKVLIENIERSKADFELSQQQLVSLQNEYEDAKAEWNNEKLKLAEAADEVAEKVEVLEFKLEEIKKLNLTNEEQIKVKQISDLAGQVIVLNRKCLYLENENTEILNDLKHVRADILNSELAVKQKVETINKENGSLRNEVTILQIQLKNKTDLNLYAKLQNEFDNLTIKHRDLLNEVSKIRTNENLELQTTKQIVETLKQEKQSLISKIQGLMIKINSYEVSSFEIDKAIEILTKKLSQSEINEITEKQRANHMSNLYELVKEQLKKSEERLHEFEKYNKEVMEKNLKLQESIRNEQNKILFHGDINVEEYDSLRSKYESLLKEHEEIRTEYADLKQKLSSDEKLRESHKLWTSSQEYELLSLKHQILDLQAATDDKVVISRLSSDVVQARLIEAETMRKFENLQDDYKKVETAFEEYKKTTLDELNLRGASNRDLIQKVGILQEIILQQRHQYSGYVPLISESKYVENILQIYQDRYESFLNLCKSENTRNEIEITKEQLKEQLKMIASTENEEISKWFSEKSLIQLQELKHRRKAEFLQTQLEQIQEKVKIQDQHMSKLEEALFLAYQHSEVEIPRNLESVKLKLTEEKEEISTKSDEKIKIYKSEETQTIFDRTNGEDVGEHELEKIQMELLESQDQIKIKEESIELLKSKVTELEMNLSLFKTQLGDKQSQIMFYEKHILELQNKKEIFVAENEELSDLKATMVKLQAVLLEKEEEILKYQALLKQDRDEHSLAAQRMQEELRRLQTVLNEHQHAYNELKEVQNNGSPGKVAVEQYIKQVHALENHTDELHTKLFTVESQLQAAREENVRWRSLANDRLESMEKLRKDLEEMHKNELKVYKDDCEKWRQEVLSLKTFVSKFEGSTTEKSAELQKLIKDKDNRIHELTVHLRQLKVAARKKAESAEVSPHLQEIESEKDQILKELETVKRKCESLLNKEKNYREEIRTLKNQLMKRPITSARSDKSDSVKDQLFRKVSTLEKENAELKENLQQQLMVNETHRMKVAEDFDRWNKQKFFQQTAEKLKVKLKEKSDENDKLQQTCCGYRILIEKLEREKHALENKNKNLRASSGAPVKLEMLEIENVKLQAEVEAANAKLEMAQHHSGALGAAMLQEKLEAQERKIAVLELASKGTGELRNEIERLQSALANLHKVNLRLEAENLECKLDKEKSTKELPQLREQIHYLENYVEVLKTENSSKQEPNNCSDPTQQESKKVSELERTVFVLKRIVEKLQAENKRLQSSNKIHNDKTSDDTLRINFYKLKDQYGDSVQKIARLETELNAANLKANKSLSNQQEVEELKSSLEQKSELLEKVKVLLHRAATKEKALLEEISRLKSMIPCSSTSVSST